MDLAPWQSKTVTLDWQGRTFTFAVSQELFSSNAVDQGTRLLVKSLPWNELGGTTHIVDFGCGYGPLGIVAATQVSGARLMMIDRDALAVAFAAANASANLPDRASPASIVARAGLDLHDIDRSDLLLWNVPGKAGESVLRGLCAQLPAALEPGGLAALVVVNPLAGTILDAIASPHLDVVLTERHTAHTVIHARLDEGAAIPPKPRDAFASGVFDREERIIELGELAYAFRSVFGLPEYENPDYSSSVAIELLSTLDPVERCAIYHSGQGHVALAALLLNGVREWTLGGRDLLSLKTTKRNLEINGADRSRISLSNTPEISILPGDPPVPLVVVMLDEQLRPPLVTHLLGGMESAVAPGGQALLAGRSTSVTRVASAATRGGRFRAGKRLKRHGASAALLRRV